ncbi:hypothetical protein AKJ16_DCAP25691 [Drosera capensis]
MIRRDDCLRTSSFSETPHRKSMGWFPSHLATPRLSRSSTGRSKPPIHPHPRPPALASPASAQSRNQRLRSKAQKTSLQNGGSDIFQHRSSNEEGNYRREYNAVRRAHQHIEGEKCPTLAIFAFFSPLIFILVFSFYCGV